MYSIVLCTCKNEKEASRIALSLLKGGLAACVNIVNNVKSLYRWKGRIESGKECMMIIKTRKPLVDRVMLAIKKTHPYKVPEILEVPITRGNRDYLNWISEVT